MNQHTHEAGTLFPADTTPAYPVPHVQATDGLPGLDALDWNQLHAQLNAEGVALTPPVLSQAQCQEITDTFDKPELFRSTVVMQRHQFGRGTYKYYADTAAVPLIRILREQLYPPMAWIANQWADQLNERTFPPSLEELLAECADRGQRRSTPLILRYGPGDYACLHQDIYGDIVFPLQIAIMLNQPGTDFTGGENVFVEQRPRAQSRAIVVKPERGQGMIFPVRHRPTRGDNGFRRHPMRHGTNTVTSGQRNTLGLIFHNAR
ncbi:2OG-Fe(II) oxygenase [Streptomyces spiramenti]|uniref:2OG-Fe(II) oxygenase n=1 Tax=Streptomyces spiramenti TaxID=2720606 RepID=A0ABX1AE62_9ACTN|nr:2OG-Fe(II) oxygenase [Streptomyces spiramenti]NJP65512.1 2OG-Fe(II) oxygenase [Streptomyces spiramenti]